MGASRILNEQQIDEIRIELINKSKDCDTLENNISYLIDNLSVLYYDERTKDQLAELRKDFRTGISELKERLNDYSAVLKKMSNTCLIVGGDDISEKLNKIGLKVQPELSLEGTIAGTLGVQYSGILDDLIKRLKGDQTPEYQPEQMDPRIVIIKDKNNLVRYIKRVPQNKGLLTRIYNAVGELFGLNDGSADQFVFGTENNTQTPQTPAEIKKGMTVAGGAAQAKINLVNNIPAQPKVFGGTSYGGTSYKSEVNNYYRNPEVSDNVGTGAGDVSVAKTIGTGTGTGVSGDVTGPSTVHQENSTNPVTQTGLINDNSNDVVASVISDSNLGDTTINDSSTIGNNSTVTKTFDFNKTGIGIAAGAAAALAGYGAYKYSKNKDEKEDEIPNL